MIRNERGQSAAIVALFLLFVGVMLLVAIGVSIAYAYLARTQAAADAGALAGAREATVREIKVGGKTVCRLAEINPETAGQRAREVWDWNLNGSPLQTVEFRTTTYPETRPIRFRLYAEVESAIPTLAVIGKPWLRWPVFAEAELEQECQNPLTGPVFALPRPLPDGWPIPGAEWIWNFPMAETNAPVAWPVYFLKIIQVPKDTTVSIYVAADANYEILVDDGIVFSGSGPEIQSTNLSLTAGPHMLLIRAMNPAPAGPFTGPNPAGIVVGMRDHDFNTLAITKGNPIDKAGRPQTPDDWSSWSPPNPDWTVYADPFYPTSWVLGGEELVNILKDVGFTHRTANDLRSWMLTVLGMGRAHRTVTVMAQDVVPDTVVHAQEDTAILRYYLNSGGSVLWMGDVPLYKQGLSNGSTVVWGTEAQEKVLGIPNATTHWFYAPGQPIPTPFTPEPVPAGAGYGIGVSPWWEPMISTRALEPYCWLQPLARISTGGVAAWRMSYWPLEPDCKRGDQYVRNAWRENAPGFVRIYDAGVYLYHNPYLVTAITVAGQMAGWYRGQSYK